MEENTLCKCQSPAFCSLLLPPPRLAIYREGGGSALKACPLPLTSARPFQSLGVGLSLEALPPTLCGCAKGDSPPPQVIPCAVMSQCGKRGGREGSHSPCVRPPPQLRSPVQVSPANGQLGTASCILWVTLKEPLMEGLLPGAALGWGTGWQGRGSRRRPDISGRGRGHL